MKTVVNVQKYLTPAERDVFYGRAKKGGSFIAAIKRMCGIGWKRN